LFDLKRFSQTKTNAKNLLLGNNCYNCCFVYFQEKAMYKGEVVDLKDPIYKCKLRAGRVIPFDEICRLWEPENSEKYRR
jgi:hypothetical protein